MKGLLSLPKPALQLILQNLDQYSLACTAVTCSTLSDMAVIPLSKVWVPCSIAGADTDSLASWHERHGTSIAQMTECSFVGDPTGIAHLSKPPGPGLRQLQLQDISSQLQHGGSCVLRDCTSLTTLNMQDCMVSDASAAAASIAAMPELCSLALAWSEGESKALQSASGRSLIQVLQLPSTLTYLSLQAPSMGCDRMGELSALVNLQHLTLQRLSPPGVPAGLPAQLVRLTCLEAAFQPGCNMAEQLQHLSSLTALQQLSFSSMDMTAADVAGIQPLSQLTGLQLASMDTALMANATSWACKAALQSLALQDCGLQPGTLAGITNLQVLSLQRVLHMGGVAALFKTVVQLPLLTDLLITTASAQQATAGRVPPTNYTALTSSTNLCSLQLALSDRISPGAYCLFEPEFVYPQLRVVDLQSGWCSSTKPVSALQLQHLCSSCPALESLEFVVWRSMAVTVLLPLLQLSALTCLGLHRVRAAAPAVLAFTAELSALRQLNLTGLPQLRDPALLHLTALTALRELRLYADNNASAGASSQALQEEGPAVCLRSEVSPTVIGSLLWLCLFVSQSTAQCHAHALHVFLESACRHKHNHMCNTQHPTSSLLPCVAGMLAPAPRCLGTAAAPPHACVGMWACQGQLAVRHYLSATLRLKPHMPQPGGPCLHTLRQQSFLMARHVTH
jgi:Leucine-rich repeat (LRR) protein